MTFVRALRAHLTIAGVITGLAIVLTVAAAVKGWPPNVQPLIAGGVGVLLGGVAYRMLHSNESAMEQELLPAGPLPDDRETLAAHHHMELLTLMLRDGRRFITRNETYRHASLPPTWEEFDNFVRAALKERFGVEDVEIFQVSDDGEFLLPMRENELRTDQLLSARTGSLGAAVSCGRITVEETTSGTGLMPRDLRDCWLLPLRSQNRTTTVVRVRGWPLPAPAAAQLVGPLREQLEFLWHAVFALQRQAFAERAEASGGVLTRYELLTMLDRRVREAHLTAGTISLLAVYVEGADLLDKRGLWPEHDLIVNLVGESLQMSIPQGCAVGRLTDDTFLLLLRDVNYTSDGAVVNGLLRSAQSVATAALEQTCAHVNASCATPIPLRLRAGFASLHGETAAEWQPVRPELERDEHVPTLPGFRNLSQPARRLVLRAASLARHASSHSLDIAHDQDENLPSELQDSSGHATPASPGSEAPAPQLDLQEQRA